MTIYYVQDYLFRMRDDIDCVGCDNHPRGGECDKES